jgi:uncharacterized protein (TIGR02145 family)
MTPTDKQTLWNAILKLNNKPYIGSGYGAYNNVKNPALRGGLYTWKYRDMRELFNELVKYCELGQYEATWRVLQKYKTKIYPAYLRKIFQSLVCSGVPPFVTVGNQVWSTKNLNVTTYRNGDSIPFAANQTEWDNYAGTQTGAWRYYNDDPAYETIYGKWYNSYAQQDPRNLAPAGYHLPTVGEWETLNNYLISQSQTFCGLKNVSLGVWSAPNTDAANLYDFEIVPGGGVNVGSGGYFMGEYGYYWIYVPNPNGPIYAYFSFDGTCSPNDFTITTLGNGMTARIIDNTSLVRGQLFGGGMLLENLGTEALTAYLQGGFVTFANDYPEIWGCDGFVIGASSGSDGYANTQLMLSNACNSIVNAVAAPGTYIDNLYDNWYVPAFDEALIQIQQVPEYEALLDPKGSYWTSTEANAGQAYVIYNPTNTPGLGNWSIRAVSKSLTLPFLGMRKQAI